MEDLTRMEETEIQKRPTLTDSKEFAIIRSIHFEPDKEEKITKTDRNQSR